MRLNGLGSNIFEISKDALERFAAHEGTVRSGYVAFCMLLGVFPFLIFLAHLSGFLLGENESKAVVNTLISFTPSYLKSALQPTIEAVLQQNRADVMSLALIVSIWFPSKAVDGLRVGFDHAYGNTATYGWLKGRLISMAVVIAGALVSIALTALIILGPILSKFIQSRFHFELPFLAGVLRNTIGFMTFVVFSWFLHQLLSNQKYGRGDYIWSGIIAGSVLWVSAAIAFGVYLDHSSHYEAFYGTLAGIVIAMMFFYFTCAIFLISAELNAALNMRAVNSNKK